jgi:hypothetical protein
MMTIQNGFAVQAEQLLLPGNQTTSWRRAYDSETVSLGRFTFEVHHLTDYRVSDGPSLQPPQR